MKSSNISTLIIIPVFNESKVIFNVIKSIQKEGWKNILVVDDGSSDNTFLEVSKAKIKVIRHSINRGKGAAIKTGFEAAKILNADIIVTLDGDGQHDPKDIKNIVDKIKEGYDVVLGIRDFKKKHIPKYKAFANYLGNLITWVLYGLWVNDSQSGFRSYNNKSINLIKINNDRYEFESEIVREIHRHKLKWTEKIINVKYSYYDQNKINKQSIIGAIKTIFKLVMLE